MSDALFGDEGLRVAPSALDEPGITPGERLRRRQASQIANGYHPLALATRGLRLHPDAPRLLDREAAAEAGDYPRCGTCAFRVLWGGHARDFPKCEFGVVETPITDEMRARWPLHYGRALPGAVERHYPRVSHGQLTDVRAWWPACTDWEGKP